MDPAPPAPSQPRAGSWLRVAWARQAWKPGWAEAGLGAWAASFGPGPSAAILMARHGGPDSCAFS